MIKNIAIVAGGDSSEYEVSLRSAEGLYGFIDKDRYNLYIVTLRNSDWNVKMPDGTAAAVDKNDFSFQANGRKIKFDYAYITIHGRPGEDGRLQGYFDMLGVPYSSCGVLAGALTFNKFINNQFLKSLGFRVADSIRLLKGQEADADGIINKLGLPVFVKPNDGGSSFGVTKVKEASQLEPAIEKAFAEGREVIIERFIDGTEITCGCYKTETKQVAFPITEVVTDNEFFDYDAKYNGQVQEITPARISKELTEEIQRQTLEIYDIIGAHGIIRIDYIIPGDRNPVLLEINTNPGMTATSFIPQQIRVAGLDIKDVMTEIIENR
ncbi:MAG: D-alanine--D-alanine ligase [Tannerella sp.]|jgi:D-alanine-D-alanine ligase|nr:D-alanine--D-alanine ligase [Tannerella sp.]